LVEACDENQLRLSISDNGCGFDTSSAKRGYGLRIMQSRADLVSASFKVNSALGGPTTVTVEFNRYDVAAAD
jgi:signal transduction histidine kinase